MSEMNQLEAQLQSWTPRRPSEKVREQLFPARDREVPVAWPKLWRVVTPAFACFLALFAIDPAGFRAGTGQSIPAFAPISSNTVDGSLSLGDFFTLKQERNLEWNIWTKATFEWTNRQVSSSSNGSLQLAETNLLFR